MSKLFSGDNGELTLMELIDLLSFWIAVQNLDLNLTQEDKQDLLNEVDARTNRILGEIHEHLEQQDKELKYQDELISKIMRGMEHEENKEP